MVDSINQENKISPSRKKEIYDYILSGKLVCGFCKHRMIGVSGTSRTKETHYYYACTTKKKRKLPCTCKAMKKHELEDLVISITTRLLSEENNIEMIAENIFNLHQKETQDNTQLKFLEKQKQDCVKKSKNIISAIEEGIVTELTKTRLVELENQMAELDFQIAKEKQRNYSFLTIDDITEYLQSKVFANTDDIKIRKLLVNTFIRQIILYEDEIVITYNFVEPTDHLKINSQTTTETEQQINSALSQTTGSFIKLASLP